MDEIEPIDRVYFYGNWREFLPIVLTNIVLTIVTLGIYRFWALTRERQYLWSRTVLIDEQIEWTGTGRELLIGFLLAAILFGGPLIAWNFGIQALILQGHEIAAAIVGGMALLFLNYVVGVARFRALRYRLGRTYWHGIRGGSNGNGLRYGWSNLWKWGANYVSLGLAVPWTMTSLWNDRWREMSFGQLPFEAKAKVRPIAVPFLLFYLVPIMLAALGLAGLLAQGGEIGGVYFFIDAPIVIRAIILLGTAFAIYWFIGIIFLNYYAAFYKEAVGALRLGEVSFRFEANAAQWMMLYIVDALLIVVTLGLGWFFLGYRHWVFFITHLEVEGSPDLSALVQSQTREDSHGEGLLDAMDIGAF